jgi:putative tryptophan/tyrosine transport system substrate-binding protein
MLDLRRREFIALLGGAATVWPFRARAQQPDRMRRVGVLMTALESDSEYQTYVSNFRKELQNLGWAEGHNLRIDYRWGALNAESRQQFAKELIAMQPDVIFSQNTPTTATLRQQTQTVPIVFVLVSDPIGAGFVTSFPRPGGNITGFISMEATVAGKWLGLLKEIAPNIARVIFLFNPTTAPYFELYLNPLKAAAQSQGVAVIVAPVHDASELETVVALNAREPNGGLVACSDAFLNVQRKEVTSLAARYRLPAIYPYHYFFDVGGLMYYGPEMVDQYRRAASYINRILKGEKPAELPVQAPTKYELAINLKTAKALGLTVPPTLLARADEVIE